MRRLKFKVEIDCENDAFWIHGPREFNDSALADMLRDLAGKIDRGMNKVHLIDANGNSCGIAEFELK